jgi:hypothetical protein
METGRASTMEMRNDGVGAWLGPADKFPWDHTGRSQPSIPRRVMAGGEAQRDCRTFRGPVSWGCNRANGVQTGIHQPGRLDIS